MSTGEISPRRRHLVAWSVPGVVIAAVAGGAVLLSSTSASGHPNLRPLTPTQLLTKVQKASAPALSGKVSESAHLGLPDLPGADESASLSWTSLVSGTHTAKVWLDGVDKQRVALLGTLSEAEVVHNGRDVWTYTSTSNQVSHSVLPQRAGEGTHRSSPGTNADSYNPSAVAADVLKAIDPSTSVRVDTTQVVAGHDAYTLVLSPRDRRSTVREVAIAIDSKRFVPLRVQVFGAGSAPAFEVGFTKVSFATPNASVFRFHTPAGATVVTNPFQARRHHHADGPGAAPKAATPPAAKDASPKVIGSGWTTVVEFPGGLPTGVAGDLVNRMTRPIGSSGDRLLSTSLLNGVLLKDGRVFVGAVTPALLEHVAATTPR